MGGLTTNRKRGEDCIKFGSKYPIVNSPDFDRKFDFQVSKKPKLSSMQLAPERVVPSKSVASKIAQYPQPIIQFRRVVHAPCRVNKFRSANRDSRRPKTGGFGQEVSANEMGNILVSRYEKMKNSAVGTLRYFKKGKEVIDADADVDAETVINEVSDDSSIEEIEFVDDGPRKTNHEPIQFGSFKPSSSTANLDLANSNLNLDNEAIILDSRSPKHGVDVSGVPVYKKLLQSAERSTSKLNRLRFDIELNEKRHANLQLLRPVKKQEEVVLWEPFVELSKEEKAEIKRALSNSSRRKVLVTHENSNIEITGEVLQCLSPGAWLNDEVINLYLELLKERENREPNKFLKCHFFNTFFYKKLIGRTGYEFNSVRRWTSKRKLGYFLLDCDKIFVPIHKEVHWVLAVINKKEKKFQYLDSLRGSDSRVLKVLARYFVDEVKDKSGKDIDVSSWKEEYVEDLPEQENGFDCGVFMIKYADFYSRGAELCFKQGNMPYFRLRTAKEILRLKAE